MWGVITSGRLHHARVIFACWQSNKKAANTCQSLILRVISGLDGGRKIFQRCGCRNASAWVYLQLRTNQEHTCPCMLKVYFVTQHV